MPLVSCYNSAACGVTFDMAGPGTAVKGKSFQDGLLPASYYPGCDANQSARALFSTKPRFTLRQAFNEISHHLPQHAKIGFLGNVRSKDGVTVSIEAFPDYDPEFRHGGGPRLSYEFYPATSSIRIGRIQADPCRKTGLGSALILSQLPFWEKLGVQSIAVIGHEMSEGFYKKLGFADSSSYFPEKPFMENTHFMRLMRLDLSDSNTRQHFLQALRRGAAHHNSLPESHPMKCRLQNISIR